MFGNGSSNEPFLFNRLFRVFLFFLWYVRIKKRSVHLLNRPRWAGASSSGLDTFPWKMVVYIVGWMLCTPLLRSWTPSLTFLSSYSFPHSNQASDWVFLGNNQLQTDSKIDTFLVANKFIFEKSRPPRRKQKKRSWWTTVLSQRSCFVLVIGDA